MDDRGVDGAGEIDQRQGAIHSPPNDSSAAQQRASALRTAPQHWLQQGRWFVVSGVTLVPLLREDKGVETMAARVDHRSFGTGHRHQDAVFGGKNARSKVDSITPRRSIPSGLATRGIVGPTSLREHRTGATRILGRDSGTEYWFMEWRVTTPSSSAAREITASLDSLVSRINPRVSFE